MKRTEIERRLESHRQPHTESTQALLDRCESEVHDHAHELAWRRAREVAERTLRRFERGFGLPASEVFVAREICHEIARELRHREPHVEQPLHEEEWIDAQTLTAFDAEARRMLADWVGELAEREEHAAWKEIVSFTDHFAPTLIRRAHLERDLSWDFDHSYSKLAARIAQMVIDEFEAHVVEAESQGAAVRSIH